MMQWLNVKILTKYCLWQLCYFKRFFFFCTIPCKWRSNFIGHYLQHTSFYKVKGWFSTNFWHLLYLKYKNNNDGNAGNSMACILNIPIYKYMKMFKKKTKEVNMWKTIILKFCCLITQSVNKNFLEFAALFSYFEQHVLY